MSREKQQTDILIETVRKYVSNTKCICKGDLACWKCLFANDLHFIKQAISLDKTIEPAAGRYRRVSRTSPKYKFHEKLRELGAEQLSTELLLVRLSTWRLNNKKVVVRSSNVTGMKKTVFRIEGSKKDSSDISLLEGLAK